MSTRKYPEDFINKIICGDNLSVMKKMPAKCIDMVICSPPYWGLRDYGFEQIFSGDKDCEHEWNGCGKSSQRLRDPKTSMPNCLNPEMGNICSKCQAWKGQLGLEPTPEFYIEHLTEIFNEAKRILKIEGTLWLNLGDTYWSAKGSCFNPGGGKNSLESSKKEKGLYPISRGNKSDVPNLPQKCLAMIPERLAWSLIQNGWILRNKIIWYKPNAMPSSVTDRFSNRWEYLFMFSRSQKYYFDLDAIRGPLKEPHRPNLDGGSATQQGIPRTKVMPRPRKGMNVPGQLPHGIHRKRHSGYYRADGEYLVNPNGKNPGDVFEINIQPFPEAHFAVFPEKLCEKPIKAGCPENGIVLDPFAGAGTALYVAKEMRRRYIGIDIKQEYCDMCEKRLAQGVL